MTYSKGYVSQQAPFAGQAMTLIDVIVPDGVYPGCQLIVINPFTHEQLQVTVPGGLAPGMAFKIQVSQFPTQKVVQEQARNDDDCLAAGYLAAVCFCCCCPCPA